MPRTHPVTLSRFASRPHESGSRRNLAMWLALPGVAALVVEPALWLGRSWFDPSYQSDGGLVALFTAALLGVSVLSGGTTTDPRDRRWALSALIATAIVRLAGRLLAVNTVGALALVVDVWAVAVLLGVRRRPFALHPLGVALFFALSLPVEHVAQRVLGHPLQLGAAATSEWLLAPFFPDLVRQGVLLLHPSVELAIDLPCSGARGLVLLTSLALGLWSCRAPGFAGTVRGVFAVLCGAFVANTMRIIVLFVGGAHGVPVIEEPWHSLIGATVLGLGALPLLVIAFGAPARQPVRQPLSWGHGTTRRTTGSFKQPRRLRWPGALAVSVIGLAVAHAPARPIDASAPVDMTRLPTTLGRFDGFDVPLRDHERAYYTQWGGFAQKRIYDDATGAPMTALLVRTRSPLRHLHGPETCLIGSGHQVQRLGVVPGATPVVLYRSIDADGHAWRVEASFVSDRGASATSVSEVVWLWLEDPGSTWSLVERITPWDHCEESPERCREFAGALFASLDLPMETIR